MCALARLGPYLHFCYLAGVENVRLDGEWVVGQWKSSFKQFHGPEKSRLIQDFLNWRPVPESVLAFTKKFGPLEERPIASQSFRFSLLTWTTCQRNLQFAWNRL